MNNMSEAGRATILKRGGLRGSRLPEKGQVLPFLMMKCATAIRLGSVIMITGVRTIGHGRRDVPYPVTSTLVR